MLEYNSSVTLKQTLVLTHFPSRSCRNTTCMSPFHDAHRSKLEKSRNKLLKSPLPGKYGECVFNRMCQNPKRTRLFGSWRWSPGAGEEKNQWKTSCFSCCSSFRKHKFVMYCMHPMCHATKFQAEMKNGGVTWWCRIYGFIVDFIAWIVVKGGQSRAIH